MTEQRPHSVFGGVVLPPRYWNLSKCQGYINSSDILKRYYQLLSCQYIVELVPYSFNRFQISSLGLGSVWRELTTKSRANFLATIPKKGLWEFVPVLCGTDGAMRSFVMISPLQMLIVGQHHACMHNGGSVRKLVLRRLCHFARKFNLPGWYRQAASSFFASQNASSH